MRVLLVGLIRAYQMTIAPIIPPCCRYAPTCSQYAIEAVQRFGAIRGAWLAAGRMLRCAPWGGSGPDPVPPRKT